MTSAVGFLVVLVVDFYWDGLFNEGTISVQQGAGRYERTIFNYLLIYFVLIIFLFILYIFILVLFLIWCLEQEAWHHPGS